MSRSVRALLATALVAVAAGAGITGIAGTAGADETREPCPLVVPHDNCPAGCVEIARTGPNGTDAVCLAPIVPARS